MKIEDIDKYCDLFEQELKTDRSYRVEEFIREHNLADDDRLLIELRRVASEYSEASLELTAGFRNSERNPGETIGPYKLLQQIGEGGMGTVYMAEQQQPVQRRIALKVIKPGMGSKEVIARFEAERQALAMMDHENIAKMFDAGTTQDGRPYFVMELVRGLPITRYCDDNKLTIRDRLKLFALVCQAVQHAHQKGIIHRDIKPSNVLVSNYDGRLVPKIIDFGIAKAIQQKLTDKTLFTEFGRVVGTLQYMSPEQAGLSQLDVDTRSDIYSLGVLLYELLTGATPIEKERIQQIGWEKIMQVIRDEEPPKPSTKISESGIAMGKISDRRSSSPKGIQSMVRGELDWIVMKTLEKDRSRRYDTAKQLVDDLENFLCDRPVLACPPSHWYLMKKAIKRNRRMLAGLAAIFLMLLTISTVLWWKNSELALSLTNVIRAEGEATAINDFFINDLLGQANPDLNPYQEKTTVVALLDQAALKIEANELFREYPEVEASIRLVIGETYFALGQWNKARTHLFRCVSIRQEELGRNHPKTLQALASLVDVQIMLEDLKPALQSTQELENAWRLQKSETDLEIVNAQIQRSNVLLLLGQYAAAESLAKDILEKCETAKSDEEILIRARDAVAGVLAAQHKEYDVVRSLYQRNLESLLSRGEAEHSNAVLTAKYAVAEQLVAHGDSQEAEDLYREVLDARNTVTLPDDHPYTITARLGLGWAQMNLGKFEFASRNFWEAYEQALKTLGTDHAITWLARHGLVMVIDQNVFIAPNKNELGDVAKKLTDQMLQTCTQRQWPPEHGKTHQTQVDRAMALVMQANINKLNSNLFSVFSTPKELNQAEEIMSRLYAVSKRHRGPTHELTIESGLHWLQVRLAKKEATDEMEQLLRQLRASTEEIPPGIPAKAMLSATLGSLLSQTDRSEQAEPFLRDQYLHCWGRSQNATQIDRISSVQNLLQCIRRLGRETQISKVRLKKNNTYRIRLTRPSAIPLVSLHSRFGFRRAESIYNHDQDSSFVFVTPRASNTYSVSGTALAATPVGDFQVEIKLCELGEQQTFQAELNRNSDLDAIAHDYPRESFSIPMIAGNWYWIEAKSTTFRPHLRIEDSNGQCVKWMFDGSREPPQIGFSPDKNGEFRIVVVATKQDDTGTFALSVTEYSPTGRTIVGE